MVTATSRPDVIQIRFPAPEDTSQKGRCDVVVYVRMVAGKLEINYSHHIMLSREGNSGEWTDRTKVRFSYTPALRAQVEYSAMYELWSYLAPTSRVLPGPVLCPLEEVKF